MTKCECLKSLNTAYQTHCFQRKLSALKCKSIKKFSKLPKLRPASTDKPHSTINHLMLAHFARHLGLKITDYITMNVPQKGALYRRCKSSSGPATTSVLGRLLLDPKDTPKLGLFLTPFSVSFRGNNRGVLLFFRVGKSVCALFFGVFRHENAAPGGWENCRKSFFSLQVLWSCSSCLLAPLPYFERGWWKADKSASAAWHGSQATGNRRVPNFYSNARDRKF